MSRSSFTFKLTVPNDPVGASVVAVVATHAVEYARIEGPAGAAFVDRARNTALNAMKGADGRPCLVIVAAVKGQLTVTIGSHTVTEPLPT